MNVLERENPDERRKSLSNGFQCIQGIAIAPVIAGIFIVTSEELCPPHMVPTDFPVANR
jgi:hypothetical protein